MFIFFIFHKVWLIYALLSFLLIISLFLTLNTLLLFPLHISFSQVEISLHLEFQPSRLSLMAFLPDSLLQSLINLKPASVLRLTILSRGAFNLVACQISPSQIAYKCSDLWQETKKTRHQKAPKKTPFLPKAPPPSIVKFPLFPKGCGW